MMNDIEKYEAVEKCIDETIRPYLVSDGGNIELDLVEGNRVVISFQGACVVVHLVQVVHYEV